MTTGAMFIGDNFLWRPEFDGLLEIGTGWTGFDNLLTPQLQPKAEWAAQTGVVGFEIQVDGDTSPAPNMIALLGIEMGDSDDALDTLVVDVTHWNGSAWASAQVSQHQVPAPGGGRHIIISGMQAGVGGWRVRWYSPGLSGRLGGVYAGRLIQSLDLADEGITLRFVDRSGSNDSEGGQIYTGSPSVSRQIRIPQNTLESIWAIGVPAHGREIPLGVPGLTGTADHDAETGFISIDEPFGGNATWSGVLEAGKMYRFDYEQAQDVANPYEAPRWQLDTATADIELLNKSALHVGVGTAILKVPDGGGTTALKILGEDGLGIAYFKGVRLSEISTTDHTWSNGLSTNMQSLIMQHGSSLPIIAMLYPNDAARNEATAIYGYLQLPIDLSFKTGQLYGQTLTIREQN